MVRPVRRCQAVRRSESGRMGVRVCAPSSWSHWRRTKLSTMATSWPCFDKYKAVAQPQYPSPPSTAIFILPPRAIPGFRMCLGTAPCCLQALLAAANRYGQTALYLTVLGDGWREGLADFWAREGGGPRFKKQG